MKFMHRERHRTEHIGWLRAAVLGANDGVTSTASLVAGVAAAQASHASIMTTAVAGLVAGAMSMAAGEYVSVFSQADTEKADLAREHRELTEDPEAEHRELTTIYTQRGITPALANEVATQLMAHDALGAHARDELGISEALSAKPPAGGAGLRLQLCRWGGAAIGRGDAGAPIFAARLDCSHGHLVPRSAGCTGR
jgi:VIT1/CCC1 family predicted Fe2+/Mn2+ transporter